METAAGVKSGVFKAHVGKTKEEVLVSLPRTKSGNVSAVGGSKKLHDILMPQAAPQAPAKGQRTRKAQPVAEPQPVPEQPDGKVTLSRLKAGLSDVLGLRADSDAYVESLISTYGYLDDEGKLDLDGDDLKTALTGLQRHASAGLTRRDGTVVVRPLAEHVAKLKAEKANAKKKTAQPAAEPQDDVSPVAFERKENTLPETTPVNVSPVARFIDTLRRWIDPTTEGDKLDVAKSRTLLVPATLETLQDLLSSIRSHIPNSPEPVVVRSVNDLPPHLQYLLGDDDTGGLYDDRTKRIYLLPPAFASAAKLEITLLHEGVHAGLHKKFGDMFAKQMYDLAAKLGGKEGILKLAESMGLSKQISEYLGTANRMRDKDAAVFLLHELAAFRGERGGKPNLLSRAIVSAAAKVLDMLGLSALAKSMRDAKDARTAVDDLVEISKEAFSQKDSPKERGIRRHPGSVFDGEFRRREGSQDAPMRKKLSHIMDVVNGFLSRSGLGLAAYSFVASNTAVIGTVSKEIANRVQSTLKDANGMKRASVSHIMQSISESMGRNKLSEDDRAKAMEYLVGEVSMDRIQKETDKDSKIPAVVAESRAALRRVYGRYVLPIFLTRAQTALEQAARVDSDAAGKASALASAVGKHLQHLSEPSDIETAIYRGRGLYVIGADNKLSKVDSVREGDTIYALKHDRGGDHFPRVYDYDAIMKDKQGFIQQIMSAVDNTGEPFIHDVKTAEGIFNDLTANPDQYFQLDAIHSAEPVGAPVSGRERERKYKLPNHVFGKYIKQDVSTIVPVYMSQLMNSAAFLKEFGPMDVDRDGNIDPRDTSNEVARMLNGISDPSVRQKVKRAIDASFNPNYQGARWGTEMRTMASAAQLAAAIAFMPLIVLSSLPELANHIAAGRTAMERDIAKKVMWKTITNMFSEGGRASNAMMRYRMESLGIISSELVDHAMHGISQAQEIMGLEGSIKSLTGDFYRRTGITRYTSFQEMLAGTIALESLRTAAKALRSEETNAHDKQQAISTLVRFTGVQPEAFSSMSPADRLSVAKQLADQVTVWESTGEKSVLDDGSPVEVEANAAVNKAINEGVRVRVAHAAAGDVPFYFNDPIGKVVGQFKRFFYGATANILPNLSANVQDGEYSEGAKQLMWFAGIGIPAAALGLMAAHAVKYAAVAEVSSVLSGTNVPQTPFSVWQHDKDFATNLLTESSIYATTGLLAATPYYGISERPGGLLEPLNWAASAGLVNTMFSKPESLVDNAVLAATMWTAGEKMSAVLDKRYKSRIDSQRSM